MPVNVEWPVLLTVWITVIERNRFHNLLSIFLSKHNKIETKQNTPPPPPKIKNKNYQPKKVNKG